MDAEDIIEDADVDNSVLQSTETNLLEVMSSTASVNDWSVLALVLGLTDKELKECHKDPTDNKHKAIIRIWLEKGKASWASLVSALKHTLVRQISLADEIAKGNPTKNNEVKSDHRLSTHRLSNPILVQQQTLTNETDDDGTLAQERKNRIAGERKKIENCMSEPGNNSAQGIIFVVGIFGADGTAKDMENVKSTFEKLEFAVYALKDPTSNQIVELVEAAAQCNLSRYKFVAFYFAGHGGRDESGHAFVKGFEGANSQADTKNVLIEESIVVPFKSSLSRNVIRLFFFDCCQTQTSSGNFRSGSDTTPNITPQSSPNQVIAYATSVDQKSFGDRKKGGIWTYHLCQNLMTKQSLVNILAKTNDDVKKVRDTFQLPMTVSSVGEVSLNRAVGNKLLAYVQEAATKLQQNLHLPKFLIGLIGTAFVCWFIIAHPIFNLLEILANSSPIMVTAFLMLIIITGALTSCVIYFIHMKYHQQNSKTNKVD